MRLRVRSSLAFALALPFVLAFAGANGAHADRATDIAQIHVEAIGGRARIAALRAFRATGSVINDGKHARFTMLAARPNRLRLEVHDENRTLIQATDGVHPPWELDTAANPSHAVQLSPVTAKAFLADAEFDDPLVAAPGSGNHIEFAGEADVAGQKFLRLLVTRKLSESFFLLLDPDTFFIAMRVDRPLTADGRRMAIVTRYADFRPVAGVLVAHRIAVEVNGKLTQEARLDAVEPNPRLPAGAFSPPAGASGPTRN